MKIPYTEETPRKIRDYDISEPELGPEEVEDIAEIFKTPLTGTFNWDYSIQDNRIAKLYELGKKLNWNVSMDIDWDRPLVVSEEIPVMFWDEYPPYKKLTDEQKREFLRHRGASQFSQFFFHLCILMISLNLFCDSFNVIFLKTSITYCYLYLIFLNRNISSSLTIV